VPKSDQMGNECLGSITWQVFAHLERGRERKSPGGLRTFGPGQWRGTGTYR
jgi:hypothetical protein